MPFLTLPPKYKFPNKLWVACSGGFDSMALLNFLCKPGRQSKTNVKNNREVCVAHFNHQTPQANRFQAFVEDYCHKHEIKYEIGTLTSEKLKSQSHEEYWRDQRYAFFETLNAPIYMGHNLDDAVETWIFSSLSGQSKLIPWVRDHYHRPLMLNKKEDLRKYCLENSVPWAEDTSNADVKHPRNRIRHNLMPEVLMINPGIHTTIRNKLLKAYKMDE